MVSTPKQNATAISFKNQDKLKKTLHNILSWFWEERLLKR